MDKEKLTGMIIDYIDNNLSEEERREVEAELSGNAESKGLYEELRELVHLINSATPIEMAPRVREDFERFLEKEIDSSKKVVRLQSFFYRIAAAVLLLVVGGWVGYVVSQRHEQRIAEIESRIDGMMAMMENELSASQRLRGVNVVMTLDRPDDEIVAALLKLMNDDPNSNVRLAALEALGRFVDEQQVRRGIIDALPKQRDPVVQIALIQLLVKIREKQVLDDLQKIVDDEETIQAVRDQAWAGILILS